jgi:hypothetical protein
MLTVGDRAVRACSFGANSHILDPAEQAVDSQPPGTPALANLKIQRGRDPKHQGCSSAASSCDDVGTVSFTVTALDDRTTAAMMGYRLTVSRGHAPDLFFLGEDVRGYDDVIYLKWTDGASDDQEDLDFDLDVRAVDLAGNVSLQAKTLRVQDGLGGCRVGGRRPHSAPTLGVVLCGLTIAALILHRRRRARPMDHLRRL